MRMMLLAIVWIAMAPWLYAQVSVELSLNQEQYLPREPMLVKVRITNLSGQTLEFGKEWDWLQFVVESRDGLPVVKQGEVPVQSEFSLETAQVAIKTVDLAPYYSLTIPGRYRVTATIRISQWGQMIGSPPQDFDIVRGVKIWEQQFGMPMPPGATNRPPQVRKFALIKVAYLKKLRLYFSLSNAPETEVYRVFPIGDVVSFSQPAALLDKANNLNVLYQFGARSYYYLLVSPSGDLLSRQTYDITDVRPVMRPDEDGVVKIVGGVRRPSFDDVPANDRSSSPTDVPATTP
ncbi:MAG: hypothetical protein M1608_02730 [Candidatus Omnitrophica bacterium]|nr:hypothetical protein [Candidatus Omnitrophota bacterium]